MSTKNKNKTNLITSNHKSQFWLERIKMNLEWIWRNRNNMKELMNK